MRILIIEDEIIQNENLVKIIKKNYPNLSVLSGYSCKDTRKIIKENEIDLFFVDVNLPDGSGVDLVKEIRKIHGYELKGVVFITSQMFQIVDAFKSTHCYDFLIKPYDVNDIKKIINTFYKSDGIQASKDNKAYTIIPIDNNLSFKVYHDDIIFVEYYCRQCVIHTTKGEIICKRLSLGKILNEIKSDTILQSHKSYIVNTKYINKIEKNYTRSWDITFSGIEKVAQASANYIENVFNAWEKKA
ncbi:two component transcriptional regulator, LytTR family [Clostridium cavendishii DSM 21758]|uniref:Stage 0 sporulation protein A homolog n=1 Tax=Clostridium cavendishii DSM 21758 TaxID=1121302 RepID=A0A1M6J5C8_9CLOT|nr:LytTR family DNA-binding domain-containing protein [Clostridium cavendishii]SHJ41852.1 two component transcriptional regulator, LytTR family [Clostridium cavendishii DSM 21758]